MDRIISFLKEKIAKKLLEIAEFQSPMMSDLMKNSTAMQLDFVRAKTELNTLEDVLNLINQFILVHKPEGVSLSEQRSLKVSDKAEQIVLPLPKKPAKSKSNAEKGS